MNLDEIIPRKVGLRSRDTTRVKDMLLSIDSWKYDAQLLEEASKGNPLFYTGLVVFIANDLLNAFQIPMGTMMKFISGVENACNNDNCFHNR